MAEVEYNTSTADFAFSKRVFWGGERAPAALFASFEDWRAGTAGWTLDAAHSARRTALQPDVPFDPFAAPSLGALFLDHPTMLVIDTDAVRMQRLDSPATGLSREAYTPSPAANGSTLSGTVGTLANGTTIARFNFDSVFIGSEVVVILRGGRPLAISSKSSLVLDTPCHVQPGSVGGFSGATSVTGSGAGANTNGPGSGNLRIMLETLSVGAANVDEVQEVSITTAPGQTLRGYFLLGLYGVWSHPIPVNATAGQLRERLQSGLPSAGLLSVTRTPGNTAVGFSWNVTFLTAPGNVPQLAVDFSAVQGVQSRVQVTTLVQGNQVDGTFTMSWRGADTPPLPATSTAQELQDSLLAAWIPVGLVSAHVVRTNSLARRGQLCRHGLCTIGGPGPAWGVTYTITLATKEGNFVYSSAAEASRGEYLPPEPVSANATGLLGISAFAAVVHGHMPDVPTGMSPHPFMEQSPLSLAFGGAGASAEGRGGMGHAVHDPEPAMPSHSVLHLQGGSGGSMGGEIPQQALPYLTSDELLVGYGGSGGGALHLAAANDIVLGPSASIRVDGADGGNGYRAGGGGAGGTIVLLAGGAVEVRGVLSANGGSGGLGYGLGSRGGGGGGGGRIVVHSQSYTQLPTATVQVNGGIGGLDEAETSKNASHAQGGSFHGLYFNGVERTASIARGQDGAVHVRSSGGARFSVDESVGGAEDTDRCLRVVVDEAALSDSTVPVPAPYAHNGPTFSLAVNGTGTPVMPRWEGLAPSPAVLPIQATAPSKPERVTVYTRFSSASTGLAAADWGVHIVLHDDSAPNASTPSTHAVINASIAQGHANKMPGADAEGMVGVGVVNGHWRHDANYRHTPGMLLHPDDPRSVMERYAENNRWYKVDILLNWANQTYRVRLDDVLVALDMPFNGSSVTRLGLYVFSPGTAWFDEVYAGPDDTMGFECPLTVAHQQALRMQRPVQSGWRSEDLGPLSSLDNETRHENHVSRRERYDNAFNGGLVLGDGSAHTWFASDVLRVEEAGDRPGSAGGVSMGALTFVPGDTVSGAMKSVSMTTSATGAWTAGSGAGLGDSTLGDVFGHGARQPQDGTWQPDASHDGYGRQWGGKTGRWFWYGEHDNVAVDPYFSGAPLHMLGGIGACSTNDMQEWRNEGIVMHYINITDDVYGWGQPVDHVKSGVHDVYQDVDKARLAYDNALDPFWERSMAHGLEPYSPAALRSEQGVIWEPVLRMVRAVDGVVYNESAFRNSTITCTGTTQTHAQPRLEDPEVAALCGDDDAWWNSTHDIPDLCYFSLGFNHTTLGLPPGEMEQESAQGDVLVRNTKYRVSSAWLESENGTREYIGTNRSFILREFLVSGGDILVGGNVTINTPQRDFSPQEQRLRPADFSYSGGRRLHLECPRVKRFAYRAERPKVLFNNATNEWVMWMHVDDTYQARRLAGVATATSPGGPFVFRHSLLPDGNETVDMTLLQGDFGSQPAMLARTYYATTAYLLPLAIMQPVWDSVKDAEGMVDFRVNFQRAVYEMGYDNPDDIYLQRWRMEDVEWRVEAGDWVETFSYENNTFRLQHSGNGRVLFYPPSQRDLTLAQAIPDPAVLFSISGQAQKLVLSRFVNPDDPKNSYWSPESVPAVKAQPWTQNYEDKNIVDNPVIPTVADLLIGPHRKVQYRRAKYVSISRLTPDFYNTTGLLSTVEGSMLRSADLISVLGSAGRELFGWDAGEQAGSTFPADVTGQGPPFAFQREADFYDRHHQYNKQYNDRAQDFRNFRDRQTSPECPDLHHRAMAKHTECEDILNSGLQYVDSEPIRTAFDVLDNFARRGDVSTHAFFHAMDTAPYEDCLAEHRNLLEQYQQCLRLQTPNLDDLPAWSPGQRDCVGGGGMCGPPAHEASGTGSEPGFVNTFTHSRQYGTLTNVYGDGGLPFNTRPASRDHVYSRPPDTGRFNPPAQEFGAYNRSVTWA